MTTEELHENINLGNDVDTEFKSSQGVYSNHFGKVSLALPTYLVNTSSLV